MTLQSWGGAIARRAFTRRWQRVVALVGTVAVAAAVTGLFALRAEAAGVQHVVNGNFSNGSTAPWWSTGNVSMGVVNGELCAQIPARAPGGNPWDAIIGQNDIVLTAGEELTFSFKATASTDVVIRALVGMNHAPFDAFIAENPTVTTTPQTFSFSYTQAVDEAVGQVAFQVGTASDAPWTLCLDNVSLGPPIFEHVVNGDFGNGSTAPWWSTGNVSMGVVNGELCAQIPARAPGGNPWDAIVGQNDIVLTTGEELTFSFKATATTDVVIRALVGMNHAPFDAFIAENPTVTTTPQTFSFSYTQAVDEPVGQIAFQVGTSSDTPWTLCLDDVSLASGTAPPVYVPDTGPRVRVNQVAYLPNGPKNATVVTEATAAMAWELRNAANAVVASGMTTPRGDDATSGENVHSIDFSGYTAAGTGFTLVADGETSHPFDIGGAAYEKLRLDALKFYYTQRSGVEILDSLRPGYGRPAGHVQVAPNTGDISVPCQPGVCDYTLNVSGGWYDAGDHGKYVVNGGISVYQLMSEFERTKNARTAKAATLGDNTLAIPESGNGVPDILDEARFEMQFLMSMQVPAGKPFAGMAHHKIHDENWTGLPLLPNFDPQKRELHPPSTAATLNLAATAAQCARLFAPYDHAFANRCLAAARTAWAAALANPAKYAPVSDGNGGGPYDDDYVVDEFYWAAAELYITTGEKKFSDYVLASPEHSVDVFRADGFDWKWTAALGRLDLATVPNNLPGRAAVRASVISGAQKYLDAISAHPYGLPYAPASGRFDWGSNNLILNNMVVLASAYDISGNVAFRNGVLQGINYIFGRNALNQSYVTGYGEVNSHNQHSRWYSHQLDPTLPNPPVGTLSGGPNSSIQDPKAQQKLQGCAPQFCYLDDIESWSTNELTINWNAPLAWVTAFVADQGNGATPPPATCRVSYSKVGLPFGLFVAALTVTNTGTSTVNGWTTTWAFTGDQAVVLPVNARTTQSGATVDATNLAGNARIRPRQSVAFGFLGSTALANPSPELFRLNGSACG